MRCYWLPLLRGTLLGYMSVIIQLKYLTIVETQRQKPNTK